MGAHLPNVKTQKSHRREPLSEQLTWAESESTRARTDWLSGATLAAVVPWAVLSSVVGLAAVATLRSGNADGAELIVIVIGGVFLGAAVGFCVLAAVLLRQQGGTDARTGFVYAAALTAIWTVAAFVFYGPTLRSSVFTFPVAAVELVIAGLSIPLSAIGILGMVLLNARPSPGVRRRSTWISVRKNKRSPIDPFSKG